MHLRHAIVALFAAGTFIAAPMAMAQTPADFGTFSASCMGAAEFLLGETPPGIDEVSILTPLCGCLVTSFADLSQADVDVLATDLRGESTDASHAAHGDYQRLLERAGTGLQACFTSPEVTAAMDAAQPAPGTDAVPEYRPAEEQPVPQIKLAPAN